MNRLVSLVVAAAAAAAMESHARACPALNTFHMVDAAMQGRDQTPPTLPPIPEAMVHYADNSSDGSGCGGPPCGDVSYIAFAAVATDDTTTPDRIGYRLSLADGSTLPPAVSLPSSAIEPSGNRVYVFLS